MTIAQNERAVSRMWIAAAWTVVLAVAVAAYWPGLDGPWLFDDFGSISKLGDHGGVRDWESFKAFVFGGTAGPTGRPLALATFLIDGRNWPTDAWPFKRTNLLIHLLNGILLGLLIERILSVLRFDRRQAAHIALISAAAWLLHPFLVSTTLYVVQRMAQLSATFVFAGLIGYMFGRRQTQVRPIVGYGIMSVSLLLCTFLATISKENGVLLPVFALLLEITIFSRENSNRLNRYWSATFIVAPSILILAYLVWRGVNSTFFEIVPPREFSIYERLLTESRVLVDYLQNWFIPKLYTTGVFQDHYVKSTSLLSPLTTLAATLFHAVLIFLALKYRRRWAVFSLAVLFFYVGHLLESTVINLELYFEHRNYLSAALLFLPPVVFLYQRSNVKVFFLTSTLILATLGGFLHFSATVWRDFDVMAATSAQKAPGSARAQARYAANLFNQGHVDEAMDVLDRAIANIGARRPSLLVQRIVFACHAGRLDPASFERDANILANTAYDARMINMYKLLVDAIANKNCPDIPIVALESMFAGMLQTPPNDDPDSLRYAQVQYFLGLVRVHADKPADAVAAFKASLQARPSASSAMAMAAALASKGFSTEALVLSDLALDFLQQDSTGVLGASGVSEADVRKFQETVRAESPNPQVDDTTRPAD